MILFAYTVPVRRQRAGVGLPGLPSAWLSDGKPARTAGALSTPRSARGATALPTRMTVSTRRTVKGHPTTMRPSQVTMAGQVPQWCSQLHQ